MTYSQLEEYFHAIKGSRMEHIIRLMFATGIRVGEAIALQWKDIVIDSESTGSISITKSYGKTKDGLSIKNTKTVHSNRTVYFNDKYLVDLLQARRQEPDGYIAPSRFKSKPVRTDTFSARYFKAIGKSLNFNFTLTSHYARVTYTSHSLAKGVSENDLQQQLGHVDTTLIRTTYGKSIGETRKNVQKVSLYD